MPAAGRIGASCFTIGNKAYIGLGQTNNGLVNDFWVYNSTTDLWNQTTSLPSNIRVGSVGFNILNMGYVFGGLKSISSLKKLNDLWQFDPNATGINEIKEEPKLNVYPNPTSSFINLQLSAGSINTIEITNVVGQIVNCKMAFNNSNTNCQLNTNNLSQGIYFIKATDEKGFQHTAKFVKE